MDLKKVLLKDKSQPNIYKLNVNNGQYFISYFNPSQFYRDEGYKKDFKITIDGVVYDNSNITSDGLTFKQSLFSTDILDFSCVEKGELTFDLINFKQDIKAINGTRFKLEHFIMGVLTMTEYYTIYDIYKKNDNLVTIKAYDDLVYFDKDVTTWFNSLKENNTFEEVYKGLLTTVGFSDIELPRDINGSLLCKGSTQQNDVRGYQVLGWLQERVQGFFKPIRGELKLKFIRLNTTVVEKYTASDIKTVYVSDYRTKPITKVQIRANGDDIGSISGSGTNTYVIEANPFYGGMTTGELAQASDELLENVMNIAYTPFRGTFKGLPNVEVGDCIQVVTKKKTLATGYMNKRTLRIKQLIIDDVECQGKEKREEVKLVNKHLEILRQRTLEIKATVDEFSTTMTKIETEQGKINKEMSQIKQTSSEISTKVEKVSSDLTKAQSSITQNAENIKLEVAKTSLVNYLNGFDVHERYNAQPNVTLSNGKAYKVFELYTFDYKSYKGCGFLVHPVALADCIDEARRIGQTAFNGWCLAHNTLGERIHKSLYKSTHSFQFFHKSETSNLQSFLDCNNGNPFIHQTFYLNLVNDESPETFTPVFTVFFTPGVAKMYHGYKKDLNLEKNAKSINPLVLGMSFRNFANVDTAKLRTLQNNLHINLWDFCLLIDAPEQKHGFYTSTVNQSVVSEINMTPNAIKIKAEKIDLQGYVTVSDLSGKNKTTIDGSNIKTGTISADRLDLTNVVTVGKLSQSGGTTINGDNIKTGTINAMTINAPRLQNVSTINGVPVNQGKGDITVANWDGNLVVFHYNNGIITHYDLLGYSRRADRVPTQAISLYKKTDGNTILGTWQIYTDAQGIVNASSGYFYEVYAGNNGMLRCPFNEVQGTRV